MENPEMTAGVKGRNLVAVSRAHGDAFAAFGTAARKHGGTGFGLHTAAKAVGLRTAAAVGLKCALWHGNGAPETFLLRIVPACSVEKQHSGAKYEYSPSTQKPQKMCMRTAFSQGLVQLWSGNKKPDESSFPRPSECASIGNVYMRISRRLAAVRRN
jgi:hypothetical protein